MSKDPFQQEIVLKFHNLCDEIEKDFQKENLVCIKCINVLLKYESILVVQKREPSEEQTISSRTQKSVISEI